MLMQKNITKRYHLYALFITLIFFIIPPLSAMLTREELLKKETRKAQLRGERISTVVARATGAGDITENLLTPEEIEKQNNSLFNAIRNNDPEAVENAKKAGAGDNENCGKTSWLRYTTASEKAASYGCFPSILRMLYNNNDTFANNTLLFKLFDLRNLEKKHFRDSAQELIMLGASTQKKDNFDKMGLLEYAIEQYNTAAFHSSKGGAHSSDLSARWKAIAENFSAVAGMIAYVNSVDIKNVLSHVAPEHRATFEQEYGEYDRIQLELHTFFQKNTTKVPRPLLETIINYLARPWEKKLEERRELNQREYQRKEILRRKQTSKQRLQHALQRRQWRRLRAEQKQTQKQQKIE